MALLVTMSLACASVAAEPAQMTNERMGLPPATEVFTIRKVFSADFCGPCHELRALMDQRRIPYTVTKVYEQPAVPSFPWVVYETTKGWIKNDNGQRIRAGIYRVDGPVEIIEYVTRGRN